MSNVPRILITPGEPAGIGPDVTLKIAQQDWDADLIAIADPDLLRARAAKLNLPIDIILVTPDDKTEITPHQAGHLKVIPVALKAPVVAGAVNVLNAEYVLNTLEMATRLCMQHEAQAIVTGPVHKAIMQQGGIAFSGHTEFFAQQSGVRQTVMLFVAGELKVALATTHIPLSMVSSMISKDHLRDVITILRDDLQTKFHISKPRIAVCGLNPHAGEHGHLGLEELEIIEPLIQELQAKGFAVEGPLPADTIFIPKKLKEFDAVLSMYHDQALPVIKYVAFDSAVNVTLGLPFIRTSVDHGTALDIAASGVCDTGSMAAAIRLAVKLTRGE